MSSKIDFSDIKDFSDAYNSDPASLVMTNVLARNKSDTFGIVPQSGREQHFQFSCEIPTMKSVDQKHSGRCWLYAATNILRERVARELDLEFFELSQVYLAFWDKFERCNYFLNNILATADRPVGDETVRWLLKNVYGGDGGQWDMFVNLIEKYGICPKDAMPETEQTQNTGAVNGHVTAFMRVTAHRLRELVAAGASAEEIDAARRDALRQVYDCLCRFYTEPPRSFDFEYTDRSGKYHVEPDMTPRAFSEKYIGNFLDRFVSVINAPTADKPFGRLYTVKLLGNVAGGRPVRYYNVPMDEFRELVRRQLSDGELVWFGSDSAKFRDRARSLWDDKSFNDPMFTGLGISYDKTVGLDYGISFMIHAMALTGYNEDPRTGEINRWKIENSYGPDGANGGYYFCSGTWFDRFVYQAVIDKKYLDIPADAEEKLIELEPWDPMGTLAD
ncbi:MAG: C1 family peptidase [Clostridia bacterium]|nr:C1 family peptidase [Clostridia bacterium]